MHGGRVYYSQKNSLLFRIIKKFPLFQRNFLYYPSRKAVHYSSTRACQALTISCSQRVVTGDQAGSWCDSFMGVKSHREIPALWRMAGAGRVPPFAGRKLESEEWWNKKSSTGMEGLIGLVWRLEEELRNWGSVAKDWICTKPPLQSWSPVDSVTFESGSLKLRGAGTVMMKQWFSTHFNCAFLGCSNISAGWDFSSSPLAEAQLWVPEQGRLVWACCPPHAAHSALPCPRLWAGFHHRGVSLGFPAVCRSGLPIDGTVVPK